jgi:CheY-like chemotaxis protein
MLVVDDNATNRAIVRELLNAWGCRADEAPDAVHGLQQLRQAAMGGDPYQVALVDYQMPGMDGAALGQCVRLDPTLSQTGLVCLTSGISAGDTSRLRSIGFSAILHKPLRQSHLYNTLVEVLSPEPAPPVSVPSEPVSKPLFPISCPRILLAEDNEINRRVAIGLLEKVGLRADAVGTGRQAIQALSRQKYDLVLMDVHMPDMDGFEATSVIRQSEETDSRTPIIAITANAMTGDREQCLSAGMDDYVSKPLQLAELQRVLSRWLR